MPMTFKLCAAGRHHFSFIDFCDIEYSTSCDFFDFPTFRLQSLIPHHSIHLIHHRPMLVASNVPSDPPEPLFTRNLCGRCHQHRCRQILSSGEEILASKTNYVRNSPVATTGYGRSYWLKEYGIWNTQCNGSRIGNEGIAFLSF